jgi:hypothetical protein
MPKEIDRLPARLGELTHPAIRNRHLACKALQTARCRKLLMIQG